MSDQRSNSGDDYSRFDPLPNTMGGSDVGDVGDTSSSLGEGRSGAGSMSNSNRLANQTSNPANFVGSQSGSTSASGGGAMDQAKDAMGDVQQKASDMTDQATQKADMGKDKAASGLDSLASTLRDKSQTMGDGQMGNMATMAADRLEQGAEMLRSKDTDQLVMELEDVIRQHPLESLLIAAGAGYLLSRAL